MPNTEFAPVKFGRYELLRSLARGGMAEVFLARQRGPGRFERYLVVKRILPQLAGDPRFVDMFLDEAALAARLNHANIAQVYDFGVERGEQDRKDYFIAMELVRGPDLQCIIDACRLHKTQIPVNIAVRLTVQLLTALDYAHRMMDESGRPLQVVHRDVSPPNVVLSSDGIPKLIDFGIAKAQDASHRTQVGTIKGKFSYMAPEQLRGDPLDGRVDQYAAGLLLYELLTLEPAIPVRSASLEEMMDAKIWPIAEMRGDLPADLTAGIDRMLERDRDARFVDCRAARDGLEAVLLGRGAAVPPHEVAAWVESVERAHGTPLSLVVVSSNPRVISGGSPESVSFSDEASFSLERTAPSAFPLESTGAAWVSPELTMSTPAARPRPKGLPVAESTPEIPSSTEFTPPARPKWSWITALAFAGIGVGVLWLWSGSRRVVTPTVDLSPAPARASLPSLAPPPPKPAEVETTLFPALQLSPTASTARPKLVPPLRKPAEVETTLFPALQLSPTASAARPKLTPLAPKPAEPMKEPPKHHHAAFKASEPALASSLSAPEPTASPRPQTAPASASPSQASRVETPPPLGSVIFIVKPWAKVTFNGENLGMTPMAPLRIAPGRYRASFESPDKRVVEREVTVESGKPTYVKLDLGAAE
jgi:eukaryotic-like serine/threonine-protein kinase